MTTMTKRAREMSPEEQASTLAEIKRGPKPELMPINKTAKEMTPAEQAAFIKELKKRFG
jgi:ribosomal protein L29